MTTKILILISYFFLVTYGFPSEHEGFNTVKVLTKNQISDVKLYLYTLDNPDVPHELIPGNHSTFDNSKFRLNTETKVFAHGYTDSGLDGGYGFAQAIKNEYLRQGFDYNIIIVHWEKFAQGLYHIAAENTRPVGEYAAALIFYLAFEREAISPLDVHFIGHSLGSHVAGFCGEWIKTVWKPIRRISGLDPALPLFGDATTSERLDREDANFVDIIHTAGGPLFTIPPGLGFTEPIGDIDFYPNDGTPIQPGCGLDIGSLCSHFRAPNFLIESIGNPNAFLSCKCDSWAHYNSGNCNCPGQEPSYMGEHTNESDRGLYFLRTNKDEPFSQS